MILWMFLSHSLHAKFTFLAILPSEALRAQTVISKALIRRFSSTNASIHAWSRETRAVSLYDGCTCTRRDGKNVGSFPYTELRFIRDQSSPTGGEGSKRERGGDRSSPTECKRGTLEN